ncbi:21852_t:CDS:2 [Gigaspora margarita]|uniref:21852_t:CDS:1 n=1 Tax=Gigaspora margarita TaxID=4874 RepID=A0ABN7UW36_GIGMA|nr:21852_t:CDS:2 [Gigaspora margarita]
MPGQPVRKSRRTKKIREERRGQKNDNVPLTTSFLISLLWGALNPLYNGIASLESLSSCFQRLYRYAVGSSLTLDVKFFSVNIQVDPVVEVDDAHVELKSVEYDSESDIKEYEADKAKTKETWEHKSVKHITSEDNLDDDKDQNNQCDQKDDNQCDQEDDCQNNNPQNNDPQNNKKQDNRKNQYQNAKDANIQYGKLQEQILNFRWNVLLDLKVASVNIKIKPDTEVKTATFEIERLDKTNDTSEANAGCDYTFTMESITGKNVQNVKDVQLYKTEVTKKLAIEKEQKKSNTL